VLNQPDSDDEDVPLDDGAPPGAGHGDNAEALDEDFE
jgi:hypothetical protein